MFHSLLLLAAGCLAAPAAAASATEAARPDPACHRGVQHVSMLSAAQMCPRPLATTIIARPQHGPLHT